jgi:hypothetical protein
VIGIWVQGCASDEKTFPHLPCHLVFHHGHHCCYVFIPAVQLTPLVLTAFFIALCRLAPATT